MLRRFHWTLPVIALALFAGACSPLPTPTTNPAGTELTSSSNSLVIYSGRSENLVGPLIEQFEASSGLDVEVRYGSTPEIAATLLEEGANSPADVFFAQDPGGLGAAANAGLLAPLPDETLNAVMAQFRSPDGLWVGVSGRARVVVYNTDLLTPEDLPDDLAGFTDPAWDGRVGWVPTNASFQVMITAMRVLWGEDETRAWLEAMQANHPVVYENNAAVVAAVAAGEVEVGLVNHYYLYRFLAEQGEAFPARNYFLPSGGPGSLVMVAGAAQLANSPHPENALAFINYLVSPEAQAYFVGKTNEYPVIEGVAAPTSLPAIAELHRPDISLTQLADLQGTTRLLQDVGLLE